MKRAIGMFALVAMAQTAEAQVPGLPYWLWTAPGASENGNVKTYVACTNNGTAPATIGVQIFGFNGAPLNDPVATQLTLNANETRLFGSNTGGPFVVDATLATPFFNIGSAQVFSSVPKKVSCSAWLSGAAGMTNLTVVKKYTQKGQ